jgi:hypothetical protein
VLGHAIELKRVGVEVDPEAAATGLIKLTQGLVMQSMPTGRPGAMRQRANRVFALYLRGLEGGG